MKKIKFIVCYFGEWPVWFDGFLLSCKHNKDIDWLFFTDCTLPANYPPNIKFVKCPLNYLSELATKKLKFTVKITKPYKLCDLKPAYGLVFEDYLEGYDFWGMCDIDVIFGDIKNFVTNNLLNKFDIISSRKRHTSGHFTLFKNNNEINNIFREIDGYRGGLQSLRCRGLDEISLTRHLKQHIDKYKISWNTWLLNFPDKVVEARNRAPGNLTPDCGPWHWNKGKLFINDEEIMYLHFMTWKRSIKNINFNYEDDVDSFYVSSSCLSSPN